MKKEKTKTKTKTSEKLATGLLVLALFVGLAVMAYPSFSNWWNEKFASQAIFGYDEQVGSMSEVDCEALFAEAQEYNLELRNLGNPFANADQVAGYDKMLRIPNSDVMGYLTIKKIDLQLPIYHGTDESVLAVGVGHLQGSSLPTGELGEHTVLSAHRGLPSAKLFSSLDKLEVGDRFTISVLKRRMTYQIDSVSIVLPEEVEGLSRIEDGNYCTLVTCTPYGVNTHRLLVRGVRVENDSDSAYVAADAFRIDTLTVAPIVALPLLVLVVVGMIARSRRKEEDDDEI